MKHEEDLQHGALTVHPLHRKWNKVKRKALASAPAPYDWTKLIAVPIATRKDQLDTDECGGMAGSFWEEVVNFKLTNVATVFSEKSIYAPIHYPGGGTTVPALQNQLAKKGANTQVEVPSTLPNGSVTEDFVEDTSWETPALALSALKWASKAPVDVSVDIDTVASYIRDSGAVILEIQGQNGLTPSWLSPTPSVPVSNVGLWTHFLCACGTEIINGVKYVAVINSWGPAVGSGGVQYLSEEYFKSGYILDAFTLFPVDVVAGGLGSGNWLYDFYENILKFFTT